MSSADNTVDRFAGGETLRVRLDAPAPGRVGEIGEVCGVAVVRTREHDASVLGGGLGQPAYLVEFEDGTPQELVGNLLEKVEP
jgi:hypothetical protein